MVSGHRYVFQAYTVEFLGKVQCVLNWPNPLYLGFNLSWPSCDSDSEEFWSYILHQTPFLLAFGSKTFLRGLRVVTLVGAWLLNATSHVYKFRILAQWVCPAYLSTKNMTLKCMWYWGSSLRDYGFYGVRNYLLVTIIPGDSSICQGPIYGLNSLSGKVYIQ